MHDRGGVSVTETLTVQKFDGPPEDRRLLETITIHPDGRVETVAHNPDEEASRATD